MGNPMTGSVRKRRGKWSARVSFTHPDTGKRVTFWRGAETKTAAIELRDQLLREAAKKQQSLADGGVDEKKPVTVGEVCDRFLRDYVTAPTYKEGRKASGLRSWKTVRSNVELLRNRIGRKRLATLTHGTLATLRRDLLDSTTWKGTPRSIASTNRVMATLRRMLRIAVREDWITRDPFIGDPLITIADEMPRETVISPEEERALLAALLEDPAGRHLEPFVVALLDTGCRAGELKKLEWDQVNFAAGNLTISATHTKTQRERRVPLTDRLRERLLAIRIERDAQGDAAKLVTVVQAAKRLAVHPAFLYQAIVGKRGAVAAARYRADKWRRMSGRWYVDEATLLDIRRPANPRIVFDTRNLQQRFGAARKAAGLSHIRLHDCRHTAATRLIQGGMPITEMMRVLGHTTLAMAYRYTNADTGTIRAASEILSGRGAKPGDSRLARLRKVAKLRGNNSPAARHEVN